MKDLGCPFGRMRLQGEQSCSQGVSQTLAILDAKPFFQPSEVILNVELICAKVAVVAETSK